MSLRLIPSPAFDPFADDPTRGALPPESCPVRVDSFELVGRSAHQFLWSARQLATALGYTDPSDLARQVRDEWADEFVEGTDFVVLIGEDLQGPKDAGAVGRNAPSALFLTEPGVHLVALKSHKPAAKAVRRWLATEVMPAIRRTGAYFATSLPALREARMVANALVRAGDKSGAVAVLRRAVGLPEIDAPTEPGSALLAWLDGRAQTSASEVAAEFGISAVSAGRQLSRAGWTRIRRPGPRGGPLAWLYVPPGPSLSLVR